MSSKEDVMIALLRDILAKLDDIGAADTASPSLDAIERRMGSIEKGHESLKEGQRIIFAAVGEVFARLDATDTLPAYMLEHEAGDLFRENYPNHGPQPKAMEALATVKERLGTYEPAKLRELGRFYQTKIDSGDPYAHQASEALKLVEGELSRHSAAKEPAASQTPTRDD